jgi:capsular exopolysaccharide synthesis family protein
MEHLLVTIDRPASPQSEAYRMLRTNLMFRNIDAQLKMFNVVSMNASEGKSTVVGNLGVVFSQIDKKVLLVDLDLRLPTLHKKFRIENKLGVSDVVAGKVDWQEVVVEVQPQLSVMTAGTKTPFTSELVQSLALQRLLEALREHYDYVIIDCPPVGVVADGMIVSRYVDGTVLLVAYGESDKRELLKIKQQFEQVGVNVLGSVMSKLPMNKKSYYYQYYNRSE